MTGHLTTSTDVYSFGIVLLELISGRLPLTYGSEIHTDKHISDWVRSKIPYIYLIYMLYTYVEGERGRGRERGLCWHE